MSAPPPEEVGLWNAKRLSNPGTNRQFMPISKPNPILYMDFGGGWVIGMKSATEFFFLEKWKQSWLFVFWRYQKSRRGQQSYPGVPLLSCKTKKLIISLLQHSHLKWRSRTAVKMESSNWFTCKSSFLTTQPFPADAVIVNVPHQGRSPTPHFHRNNFSDQADGMFPVFDFWCSSPNTSGD